MKVKEFLTKASGQIYGAKDWAEKKVIGARCKAGCAVATAIGVVAPTLTVKADTDYTFLEGNDNGTFSGLDNTMKETGASFYKLLGTIGVIGLASMIVFCGMAISASKSSQKRDENKGHLIAIFAGGVLIFGSMTIIGIIKTFASKL